VLEVLLHLVAGAQAGGEGNDPGAAPSGPAAAVGEAALDRGPRGRRQRRSGGADLAGRIEGVELRDVAVAGVDLVEVLEPLLDRAELAHLGLRQLGAGGVEAAR